MKLICDVCSYEQFSDGPPFCTKCGEGEMTETHAQPDPDDSIWLENFPEYDWVNQEDE